MTERLYYHDSYLTEFRAGVLDAGPDRRRIYLDCTAFYPTSGGQPFDLGTLGGAAITDVIDEDGRIAHILAEPLQATEVAGRIDWPRRFDHMQQHTGQHLLSAVLIEMFGAATVGFHLGAAASTIDLAVPGFEAAQAARAELRANEIVCENRAVAVSFEDGSQDLGLRKPSAREGVLRVVSIDGLDRSACGGTHVRSTGEIGPILIRKLDRVRGNMRVEFLCGHRAVRRARADFDALSTIARLYSAPLDDAPQLAAAQMDKLQESDRARRRLAAELAEARGGALHAATAPNADGLRVVIRRVPSIPEELRIEAQAFAAGEKAVFLALAAEPPSVLLAASSDSGVHAGERLKAALAKAGGRGGGNSTLAQGSVPSKDLLNGVAAQLAFEP